ncbi:MAG: hypothetical protein EBY44_10895 [Actinobacteria bacterium]|nr:hypothetical protein [Actinomycetota bacterium]
MASTFALPAVGDTMVEAVVEEWFVAVGDHVALDQVICAIETDKSVVEMTTPFAGTVLQLGGEAGATIAVGAEWCGRCQRFAAPPASRASTCKP